jgi:hypothetical protein
LQFLLTPPDEGPRVKGQRIKLQDIIEGMYNPLSSNNGCWISRKSFFYETLGDILAVYTLFSLTADEFLYQNQWGEIALLTVGNLSERILMSNTTYVSAIFTFFSPPLQNTRKTFSIAQFCLRKMTKTFLLQKKKGTLVCSIICHRRWQIFFD